MQTPPNSAKCRPRTKLPVMSRCVIRTVSDLNKPEVVCFWPNGSR